MRSIRPAMPTAIAAPDHYTLSIAAADGPFVSDIDIAASAPESRLVQPDDLRLRQFDDADHRPSQRPARFDARTADARSTDRAVQQFLAAGVPPRKLLIGAAFYGREFADVHLHMTACIRPTAITRANIHGRSSRPISSTATASSATGMRGAGTVSVERGDAPLHQLRRPAVTRRQGCLREGASPWRHHVLGTGRRSAGRSCWMRSGAACSSDSEHPCLRDYFAGLRKRYMN
jgi:hypothetical protein